MTIHRYLVRRHPLGDVARYGSVHALSIRRGESVVLLSSRGTWLGEVLAEEPPEPPAADRRAVPTGEVLRRASDEDEQAAALSGRRAQEILPQLRQLLGALDGAPLDLAISLCQAYAFISWAGTVSPELGRASARIAERFGFSAVQFLSVTGTAPQSTQPSVAPEALAGEPGTARHLAAAFSEAGRERVKQRDRDPLGMLGMYRQRSVPSAGGERRTESDRFMIRIRLCGGRTTGAQLADLGRIACTYAGGTLRLTSRQGVQIHNCAQENVAAAMREIDRALLQCYGTCGNSLRNVMCCPCTPATRLGQVAGQLAMQISGAVQSAHAWEFFQQDDPVGSLSPAAEQCIDSRLPHKWKVSVATEDDNCVDVLVADVGLVVRRAPEAGFESVDIHVGGSLSYKPGKPDSCPALAQYLGTVDVADCIATVDALQRLFAETPRAKEAATRHDRRWKYIVRQIGIEGIRRRLEERLPRRLRVCAPAAVRSVTSHLGWRDEPSGTGALGVLVDAGVLDFLRPGPGAVDWNELFRQHRGPVRVMPDYGLMFCGITATQRGAIAQMLQNAARADDRCIHTCPALPTCPLAVGDVRALAAQLQDLAVSGVRIALSGCPNGCSRSLTSDIGVIAEKPGEFALFSGGSAVQIGTRQRVCDDAASTRGAIRDLLDAPPR